jgi:hypothetical protein
VEPDLIDVVIKPDAGIERDIYDAAACLFVVLFAHALVLFGRTTLRSGG